MPGPPKRADARRNYEQILAAAEEEIARRGAEVSLEEIARRAGVGSATLHRHFPGRRALLEAVFHDRVEVLCAQARELTTDAEPGQALATWLRAVAVYGATTRGLATALLAGEYADGESPAGGRAPRVSATDAGAAEAGAADADAGAKAESADPVGSSCEAMLRAAGDELLRPAQAAGAVRADVSIGDLLTLINALALATERHPDAAAEAARLTTLALDGVREKR